MKTSHMIVLGLLASVTFFVLGFCAQLVFMTMFLRPQPQPALLLPTPTYGMLEGQTPRPESPLLEATAMPLPQGEPPSADAPLEPTSESASAANNALLPDLEILSQRQYVDERGRYHIVGEVRNNGNLSMEFVEVIAQYYDEGELKGANLTFTDPDFLAPGQVVPFDMVILRREHWANEHLYTLQVKGYSTEKLVRQHLVVVSQNSRVEDGFLYVQGEVLNSSEVWVLGKAVVTLHDSNEQVINTKWDYIGKAVIAPGELTQFEVKLEHQTDPNQFNYRIQIEEDEVSPPIVVDRTPTPLPNEQ